MRQEKSQNPEKYNGPEEETKGEETKESFNLNKGKYEAKVSAKRIDPNVIMNPDAQEQES